MVVKNVTKYVPGCFCSSHYLTDMPSAEQQDALSSNSSVSKRMTYCTESILLEKILKIILMSWAGVKQKFSDLILKKIRPLQQSA